MIGAVGLYVLVRFLLENFQSTDLHEVKLHGGQLSLRNVKTFISAKTAGSAAELPRRATARCLESPPWQGHRPPCAVAELVTC